MMMSSKANLPSGQTATPSFADALKKVESWAHFQVGAGFFQLWSLTKGTGGITISSNAEGIRLGVNDARGKAGAAMMIDKDSAPRIIVQDQTEKVRASMTLSPDGAGLVTLLDKEGKPFTTAAGNQSEHSWVLWRQGWGFFGSTNQLQRSNIALGVWRTQGECEDVKVRQPHPQEQRVLAGFVDVCLPDSVNLRDKQ